MALPPPAPIAAAAAPPPAWRADPRLPWAVLALSLLLTLVATLAGLREAQQRRHARFEAAAQAVVDRLEVRLQGHVALLQGVAGLFSGSDDVTREEFRAYLEQLQVAQRFPGVQGVGYSPRVLPGEEVAVVARALAEGLQGFHLWPEPGPADAGRPRFTILFLEPLDARNRAALGYDMSTEPVRAAAMARARDTGQPALSGKVELKQEIGPQKQPGFLLYLPLYERGPRLAQGQRARLEGYVYAPFRAGNFFGHLQGDLGPSPVGF
ncbi:MAG TPA: CHASE domain-containing protein, partial [Aggregicoccus sp.]|nr:CHASE domain-containing protein [Aggregicoccus sp.]